MTAKIKLNSASGGGSFSLQAPSSSSNNRVFTIPDEADATLLTSNTSTGKILQVKNTLKTDQFSTNSTSFTDITGLSIDITASSSSNKFYISCIVFANCQDSAMLRLVKDGTVIAAGTTSTDSNPANFQGFAFVRNNSTSSGACYGIAFLDSPGDTSSHTYKVQGSSENGSSYALVVNRRAAGTGMSLSSSITAMEVAA